MSNTNSDERKNLGNLLDEIEHFLFKKSFLKYPQRCEHEDVISNVLYQLMLTDVEPVSGQDDHVYLDVMVTFMQFRGMFVLTTEVGITGRMADGQSVSIKAYGGDVYSFIEQFELTKARLIAAWGASTSVVSVK